MILAEEGALASFLIAVVIALPGCPLTVNVNLSTDKPIPVYLIVDKPIKVKMDGDIAITKVPPLHADADVDIRTLPPIRLGL